MIDLEHHIAHVHEEKKQLKKKQAVKENIKNETLTRQIDTDSNINIYSDSNHHSDREGCHRSDTDNNKDSILFNCSKCSGNFLSMIDLEYHIAHIHEEKKQLKKKQDTKENIKNEKLTRQISDEDVNHLNDIDSNDLNDTDGNDIDPDGNQCNADGNQCNAEGNQCNADGNQCNADGNQCNTDGNHRSKNSSKPEIINHDKINSADYHKSSNDYLEEDDFEDAFWQSKSKSDICDISYFDRRDLKHHIMSVHEKSLAFTCDTCGKSYANKRVLIKHIKSVHEKNEGYKSSHCDKDGFEDISAKSKSKVWNHFLLNKIDSLAKCMLCSSLLKASGSSGTNGLHNHLKAQHSIKVQKIYQSKESFNFKENPQLLNITKSDNCDDRSKEGPKNYHEVPEESSVANETDGFEEISTRSKSKVWYHFLFNKTDSLAKCIHCSALLKASSCLGTKSLHNHLKAQHSIKVQKLHQSRESFNIKENLHSSYSSKSENCHSVKDSTDIQDIIGEHNLRQMESVLDVKKSVKCITCANEFSSTHNLKRHISTVHDEKRPYMCDVCGVDYFEKRSMDRHIASVHEESQPICEICGSRFVNKRILKNHIKKLHEFKNSNVAPKVSTMNQCKKVKKMAICHICGKSLYSKERLQYHLSVVHKIETMSSGSVCDICGFSTSFIGVMKRHKREKHEVQNHHKCPHCDFHSYMIGALHIHIDSKHPEHDQKQFPCSHCSKSFIFERSLKKHMENQQTIKRIKLKKSSAQFMKH